MTSVTPLIEPLPKNKSIAAISVIILINHGRDHVKKTLKYLRTNTNKDNHTGKKFKFRSLHQIRGNSLTRPIISRAIKVTMCKLQQSSEKVSEKIRRKTKDSKRNKFNNEE